jgi:protein involved in polysaccharide export with SLBB domain
MVIDRVRIIAAILLTAGGYSVAQQNIDTAQLKELLQQKEPGLSASQLQNYTKANRERAERVDEKDTGFFMTDTLASAKKDTNTNMSVYEKIIKNISIDPDKMLKTLPTFGYDVFQEKRAMKFGADNALAAPADYSIGAGDEIKIMLWGRINESYQLKVDRDGRVNIPHLGPVAVAGMPFSGMQKNIMDRLQSIEGVQASITMGELHSISVFIVGEVKFPGMYTISALSNITNALFAAGGPTKQGSLRTVQLKRNGSQIAEVDFYDFLMSGKDNTNLRLKSGDVIMIPIVKKMAAIAGNVRRSALFEIKQGNTLKDLIALAGGITPAAWTNRIQIERFKDNQFQIALDFESDAKENRFDFGIQDGDIVKIFPIVLKDNNVIYLQGNVYRPGKYEFKTGMKISDLIPDYGTLLPETYFEYAMVIRQEPPNFLGRIIPFNPKKAMEEHESSDNLALQARDVVMVYSRDYFEPNRMVSIGGAVTKPGKQKLFENMKIRDLIIKAGGLLEEASEERGELYRRVYNGAVISTEKMEFNVRRAMADDTGNNIVLKKFDVIYIRNKKGWEQQKRVILKGEIVYPGEYVLIEGETLGEIIQRAGGFTAEAYLPAATLTRPSTKELERKRMNEYVNGLEGDALKASTELLAKQQQAGEVQSLLLQQQMLLSKLRDSEVNGRVVIDLTNKDAYKNFILENGDSLFVPKQVGTVSVIGEVYNPATFRFEQSIAKVRYYIDMAGGLKENADAKNVYIFKANGSILTRKSINVMEYVLSPADVVVVPQRMEYKNNFKIFMDTVDSIAKIATFLATVITLVVLVDQIKK